MSRLPSDAVVTESSKNFAAPAPQRKVQRHSPHRLLRKTVQLPGGIMISAEKHRGRLVVRVEWPDIKR